ncbi:MAG TPA: tagaturonate epimerase family protein [Clostridia bacterium]|nr:tagaturonate epimerase family protein [Clostridia bacterium]
MRDYTGFIREYASGAPRLDCARRGVYPGSVNALEGGVVFMADEGEEDVLVCTHPGLFAGQERGGLTVAPLNHGSADVLRRLFPFAKPAPVLSRDATCGVGDRLGIASPGHIRAFEASDVSPVLAQQSMRELKLTNRSFADVIDAATFSVFRAGYRGGFGADGDHLKTPEDIFLALETGCSMITLDCSDHIRREAPDARGIYGGAIAFAKRIYDEFFAAGGYAAELEISIDETDAPTSPEQHRFIARELLSRGVKFATLAPRFCGEFQKGIDYIGGLAQFEREIEIHAGIAREHGYKLSIHSGSDKFSVFPIIAKHVQGRFHLKTAGTSWLEAMRVVAETDPALYRACHAKALASFGEAKQYYHVTTNLGNVPPLETLSDGALPALFEDPDARQLIHITYGFILGDGTLRARLYALWRRERRAYSDTLFAHIGRHLALIAGKPLRG